MFLTTVALASVANGKGLSELQSNFWRALGWGWLSYETAFSYKVWGALN